MQLISDGQISFRKQNRWSLSSLSTGQIRCTLTRDFLTSDFTISLTGKSFRTWILYKDGTILTSPWVAHVFSALLSWYSGCCLRFPFASVHCFLLICVDILQATPPWGLCLHLSTFHTHLRRCSPCYHIVLLVSISLSPPPLISQASVRTPSITPPLPLFL